MIKEYHATTKPKSIKAIFYDGINYMKVLTWIRKHGYECAYNHSDKIIVIKEFLKPKIILTAGNMLVLDDHLKVMNEDQFRNEYNFESVIDLV